MWRFKGCPKCRGDLFIERDIEGFYEQCLQCGYLHDIQTVYISEDGQIEKGSALLLTGNKKRNRKAS